MADIVTMPRTQPTFAIDTYVNLLNGIGGNLDRVRAMSYVYTPFNASMLEAAYRGNWISRKIIDIPADDATREWRTWQADREQITAIEGTERDLQVQQKLCDALKKARLFGGSLIVLGLKGSDNPEKELDITSIKKGDLEYLHVVSRFEVSSGEMDLDVLSKTYGHPKYYQVVGSHKQQVIHPSRVIRLLGSTRIGRLTDGWGDSVLDTSDEAVKAAGLVTNGVAQLVSEAKIDVIKVPGLTDRIMDENYRSALTRRFDFANARKSILNALILDGAEEWERISAEFAALPDILKMYLLIACAAADIPATRFLGQSAVGLNATGESDIRNYYDAVKSRQTNELTPAISQLDEALLRTTFGNRPDIWYEWDSLWQETEEEKLAKAERKAKIFQIDVVTGLLDEAALAKARENQLIEDGTYPGFEDALKDAAKAAELLAEQEAERRRKELEAWFSEPGDEEDPGSGPQMPEKDPFGPDFGSGFSGDRRLVGDYYDPSGVFQEEKIERRPKGDPRGGQFAPKSGVSVQPTAGLRTEPSTLVPGWEQSDATMRFHDPSGPVWEQEFQVHKNPDYKPVEGGGLYYYLMRSDNAGQVAQEGLAVDPIFEEGNVWAESVRAFQHNPHGTFVQETDAAVIFSGTPLREGDHGEWEFEEVKPEQIKGVLVAKQRGRDAFPEFEEHEHPRGQPGNPGQFRSKSEGEKKGASPEDIFFARSSQGGMIRVDDIRKYLKLKAEYAQINDALERYMHLPDSRITQSKMEQLRENTRQMRQLRADPGTIQGLKLPGGPKDLLIVGGGPGGLQAGIAGAYEGLETMIIEAQERPGGQAKHSARIENLGGWPVGIAGSRLAKHLIDQAERYGTEIRTETRVVGITMDPKTKIKTVELSTGEKVQARAVVLAGGVEFRQPTFPGVGDGTEKDGIFVGKGEPLAQANVGKPVVVIGGGNGAAQAALGTAKTSPRVYLLARSPIEGDMSEQMVDRLRNNSKITIIEEDEIAELKRDKSGNPSSFVTKKGIEHEVTGVGVYIGSLPKTDWLPEEVKRNKWGHVEVDANLMTGMPGVYAIGDQAARAQGRSIGRVGAAMGDAHQMMKDIFNFFKDQMGWIDPNEKKKKPKPTADSDWRPGPLPPDDHIMDLIFELDRRNPYSGQMYESEVYVEDASYGRRYVRGYGQPPGPDATEKDWEEFLEELENKRDPNYEYWLEKFEAYYGDAFPQFEEAEHPRGGPENRGRFRSKSEGESASPGQGQPQDMPDPKEEMRVKRDVMEQIRVQREGEDPDAFEVDVDAIELPEKMPPMAPAMGPAPGAQPQAAAAEPEPLPVEVPKEVPVYQGGDLSDEDKKVEDAARAKVVSQGAQLLEQYRAQHGKMINTDEARTLFADVGYNGLNASAVHESASVIAKAAWRDALMNNPGDSAIIFAGGPGTGKTTMAKEFVPEDIDRASAVLDGTLSTMNSAANRIKEAAEAGKTPHLVYVWRDPVDAWENGVIKRMAEGEEGGRSVRLKSFMDATQGALNTVQSVVRNSLDDKENVGDGVKYTLIDNSRGWGKAELMKPEDVEKLSMDDDLHERLATRTKELLEEGRINQKQYDELMAGSEKFVPKKDPKDEALKKKYMAGEIDHDTYVKKLSPEGRKRMEEEFEEAEAEYQQQFEERLRQEGELRKAGPDVEYEPEEPMKAATDLIEQGELDEEEEAALNLYRDDQDLFFESGHEKEFKALTSAFEKSKLKKNTTLYRGLELDPEMMGSKFNKPEKLVGKTLPGLQLTSMTSDINVALRFANGGDELHGKGLQNGFLFVVKAPKGSKALSPSREESGDEFGENEVLFPKGHFTVEEYDPEKRIFYTSWVEGSKKAPARKKK